MRGGLSASVSHFPTSVPITGQGELQFASLKLGCYSQQQRSGASWLVDSGGVATPACSISSH